ncbi:MAG: glycoside hydrolase family 43 protein [Flavobacteriaceae bacterium]|nr:glycoside hydrolase family 43 protein [Flavobacteriaceae bacterium]
MLKKKSIKIIKFLFVLFSISSFGQEVFKNPILAGGYPDPSICKVGDTFYLVNSSFEYFPGLPIHKSTDLINWELIGHGLHRESQASSTVNLVDVQSNGGIHAPTIRYNKGVYYIISTNVYYDAEKNKTDMVNFIITANNPAGPWSDPIHIEGAPGIDPDLFFDDNGRVWYVGNQAPENPSFDGEGEIWLQELDLNEYSLIGERHLLWRGACGGVWAEGPHMYKKDGKYYLIIAEGGTSFNHAVMVAMSENIEGPYISNPRNPILTSRHLSYDNWVNSTGHGDIVELDDGRYYMVILGIRNEINRGSNMGRETFIAPLSWEREPFEWKENKDLWPVVSPISGKVEKENEVIFKNSTQINSYNFRDDFNSKTLGLKWNFRRLPLENIYSLDKREGFLRIFSNQNIIKERHRAALMGFKQNQTNFEYFTSMNFNPENNKSEAGISIFQKDDNYLNFTVVKKDGNFFIKVNAYNNNKLILKDEQLIPDYKGKIKLKISSEEGEYKLFYSTRGFRYRLFDKLKNDILLSKGYTGAHIGLYITSNGEDSNDYVDFDYVDYSVKNQELAEKTK